MTLYKVISKHFLMLNFLLSIPDKNHFQMDGVVESRWNQSSSLLFKSSRWKDWFTSSVVWNILTCRAICPQYLCRCCMQHFVLCAPVSGYLQMHIVRTHDFWIFWLGPQLLDWASRMMPCIPHSCPYTCSSLLVAFGATNNGNQKTVLNGGDFQCQEDNVEAS